MLDWVVLPRRVYSYPKTMRFVTYKFGPLGYGAKEAL